MADELSGWCAAAPSTTHTAAQHASCADHGRPCGCGQWGGHEGDG